jgi:hypothetical protein
MIFIPVIAASTLPLSVSANPGSFYEEVGASSGTVGSVVLTITGGVPPYTASWVNSSSDISVTSPTSITSSSITYSGLAVLDSINDAVDIVVEDSVTNTAIFNVSIFVIRIR